MGRETRLELLNVLGDVKARVQDKLGIVDFPMPQFIICGKQSVGKSRLIETFAGETFNFISGTLGSRRPTVLEFRNVQSLPKSKWYVRDKKTNQWEEKTVEQVMKIVGQAHEELGETVTDEPICVRQESASSVDMQVVDLPGFRDFALDQSKQALSDKIHDLVMGFMRDTRNVMICVEQANDAATMSTLSKCREVDPNFNRTILVRNKLDKYYNDLTSDTVNKWIDGFGDLPEKLVRFALTLPWWPDGQPAPKPFPQITEDKNAEDVRQMQSKGLSAKYMATVGFKNFTKYMEDRTELMFAEALSPITTNLTTLKNAASKDQRDLRQEMEDTDPQRILGTTRDSGVSFAQALTHVMEGILDLKPVMNLEEELLAFHAYHQALGSNHFSMLPSEDFSGLSDYIDYLRDEIRVATFDVEVNGGAQFRRLMNEVEIFLRFSEIAVETKKKDVIQARGVAISSLTWRDVVVKLLSNEAHLPLQRRIRYVGERIKWFFENQKEAVLQFMVNIEGTPAAMIYSPLYPKHGALISGNDMIRKLVFDTYDRACKRQAQQFVDLFDNTLTSTFSNPWVFLKGATTDAMAEADDLSSMLFPSFDDTKERIPTEISDRSSVETTLNKWLEEIPTQYDEVDTAVDRVQMLVLKIYSFIRSQVCDQVELFAESFFKLPMLRRLEEDMAALEMSDEDRANYEARRGRLEGEIKIAEDSLVEINWCLDRLQSFKINCDARRTT